jgi:hypothetical protein
MATKYFPVGYGRIYDSSKNYTEQQLRDLATSPSGEYKEDIYNTVKSFELEKAGTPVHGVTPSINVVGQDSNPYKGSSGGKGSPSINISTPSISIPTPSISIPTPNLDQDLTDPIKDINVPRPNTDQLNLSPNLDQDLTKIDVGSPNLDQKINTPTLNTEQDLTKISVRGLQESAVQQAGDAQNSLIQIGTDIQAGAVDIGKAGQEALVQAGKTGQEALVQAGKTGQEAVVQAGKATQEQAVVSATQVSGGQKNEALENAASQATKTTENVASTLTKGAELIVQTATPVIEQTLVQQATKYVEEKVMPVVNDTAKFYTENYPAVKLAQEAVHEFEKYTPKIEAIGMMLNPGETQGTEGGGTDPALDANAPNLGDDQVFSDLETATGKGSQMSEEERLRRIRRLLTNRYGREKTILGGPGDTTSRRRYAI